MTRRVVSSSSQKDRHGAYLPADPVPSTPNEGDVTPKRGLSLGEILDRQVLALERASIQLLRASSDASGLSKDQIQSLATCIKVTMELKVKENELLDNMSTEDLLKITEGEDGIDE